MAETNKPLPNINKRFAYGLEALAWRYVWETGSNREVEELIRCKDCIHHEPHPDMACQDEWVYCITYDTFKRCDGFCELGCLEEEN